MRWHKRTRRLFFAGHNYLYGDAIDISVGDRSGRGSASSHTMARRIAGDGVGRTSVDWPDVSVPVPQAARVLLVWD